MSDFKECDNSFQSLTLEQIKKIRKEMKSFADNKSVKVKDLTQKDINFVLEKIGLDSIRVVKEEELFRPTDNQKWLSDVSIFEGCEKNIGIPTIEQIKRMRSEMEAVALKKSVEVEDLPAEDVEIILERLREEFLPNKKV